MESSGNKFIYVPTDKLIKAVWNYKEDDEELQKKLENNIKKYEQLENIIVREVEGGLYEIVNGNHRYEAFKSLDYKQVFVRNLGPVSLTTAKAIAVATNESRFQTNDAKLYNVLKEINQEIPINEMAEFLPWTKDVLDDKIKSIDFSFDNYKDNLPKSDAGDIIKEKNPDTKSIVLVLQKEDAEAFLEQISRIKNLLFPNAMELDIKDEFAIKTITQLLLQMDDSEIVA